MVYESGGSSGQSRSSDAVLVVISVTVSLVLGGAILAILTHVVVRRQSLTGNGDVVGWWAPHTGG